MKNKLYKLFLLLIVLSLLVVYLNKENKAIYKVKFNTIKNSKKKETILTDLGLLDDLNDVMSKHRYNLFFNKKESLFFLENPISTNNYNKLAITLSGGKGVFYNNDDNRIRQVDAFNELFLINYNKIKNSDWTISKNEFRNILGYKCFKAELNNYNNSQRVIAWYSPSLKYQFGPVGLEGLPGLILELQIENRISIVFSISELFLNEYNFRIRKTPHKGSRITNKEFDSIKEVMVLELNNN